MRNCGHNWVAACPDRDAHRKGTDATPGETG
jgi:hypothetical protein